MFFVVSDEEQKTWKIKKTKESLVEVLGVLSEKCCSLEANSLWLIFLVFVVEMENYILVKIVCVCVCLCDNKRHNGKCINGQKSSWKFIVS